MQCSPLRSTCTYRMKRRAGYGRLASDAALLTPGPDHQSYRTAGLAAYDWVHPEEER